MISLLSADGTQLQVEDEGSGTPVVFSHGSNSDVRFWEPQRAAFAETYRFVAYNRRYHGAGGSWPSEGDNSQDAHAEDLLSILRNLAEPAHVVGFSTAIALRAALTDRTGFRTLTVIEPNLPWLIENTDGGEAVIGWWRDENKRVRRDAGNDRERRAALWFDLVNNRGPGAFESQSADLKEMWLDNFETVRPPMTTPPPINCADLAGLQVATLIVTGEFGMPYSRAIVQALSRCCPNAELCDIPDATHFVSYQSPDRFNAPVLAFLGRH